MRFWLSFALIFAVLFLGLNAFGQQECTGSKSDCCDSSKAKVVQVSADEKKSDCCDSTKAVATACSDKGGDCSGAGKKAAGKECGLPKMLYKVGDEMTCCEDTAKKAVQSGKTVMYVVGDKEYADQGEAMTAYATVLDTFYKEALQVKMSVDGECVSCPVEAGQLAEKKNTKVRYQVATVAFDERAEAEAAAKRAKAAADKIAMEMVVGDECYTCPVTAQSVATKAGKTVEYKIGEFKTPCETTAKIQLAKARILAARNAAVAS
jgi:hypothetical protein